MVLVEGNPVTKENEELLLSVRKRAKILAALGNCAAMGGVPEITVVREGRLRCQGAFAHPILAGCFWAEQLPLIAALSAGNPANATLVTPSTTTITIQNDDPAPTIQFTTGQYSFNENAGTVTIPVTLTGSTSLPASVNYAVTGGTATAGSDYTGGSGTLSFSPGTTSASVSINIANDATYENNENIILSLSSPINATLGAPSTTTITIQNDDPAPTIGFGLVRPRALAAKRKARRI